MAFLTMVNGMTRMKSYISSEQIQVKKLQIGPHDRLEPQTLTDYIEYLESRIKRLEDDFIEYILLTQKNEATSEHSIRNTESKDLMVSIDDGKDRE